MKIKDFIKRGRELYACCPNRHDDSGLPTARRVPLGLSVAARAAGGGLGHVRVTSAFLTSSS